MHSASYSACRRGAVFCQSSSAACSVGAMSVARTPCARSRLTTINVPSRPPSLRVASFMACPSCSSLRRIEMLLQSLPATLVIALSLRRLQRLLRRMDHVTRLEHEGHGIGDVLGFAGV